MIIGGMFYEENGFLYHSLDTGYYGICKQRVLGDVLAKYRPGRYT
jgi:hypothetical protein